MKLGRTIAGGREAVESDLVRQKFIEKRERKKRLQLILLGAVIVATVVSGTLIVRGALQKTPTVNQKRVEVEKYTPTVEIIDEDTSNMITERIKQYVALMEKDVKDVGMRVTKAIIPVGRAREVDIYLEGRDEYYKCNLDRGTAETVEDIVRMIGYLKKQGVMAGYVDVRLEGRAYYKAK